MTDLAPWEGGHEQSAEKRRQTSVVQKPYKLPSEDELPEVYKPEAHEFIGATGNTVNRPPIEPRRAEPKGNTLLAVLAGVDGIGVFLAVAGFVLVPADLAVLGKILGITGILIAAIASLLLAIEVKRLNEYRTLTFFPAVLVYGPRAQMEKVVGPGGISTLMTPQVYGTGGGPLSRVLDRSAHVAAPPEIVALHCDRGMGPELVPIAWEAVDDLQRGDIVWFSKQSSTRWVLFHKLIPYAPAVMTDDATRKEVFTVLKVGSNLYRDVPTKQSMGATKVLHTDADGKIVSGPGQQRGQPPGVQQGGMLGSAEQYNQHAPGEMQADALHGENNAHLDQFKIADPGAPLGGHPYDPGEDDEADRL